MMKRWIALCICILFVLLLGAGFVHAAQHLHHNHQGAPCLTTHDGCLVCAFFHRVYESLSKGLALFLMLLLLRRQRGLVSCAGQQRSGLYQLETPVTLRVKMTN